MTDKPFIQLVILSGKGGTGKTTFTSMLASFLQNKALIDCDVDAANLHIITEHNIIEEHGFWESKKAWIDKSRCNECGLCESLCRFDAIKNLTVNPAKCEGCGLCYRACSKRAISFQRVQSGKYFEAITENGSPFSYARLNPGEGNSGKLVSEIKEITINNLPANTKWVLVDGPPGIGCPVNSSLSSADYAIIVTEPTISGLHDLKRLLALLKTFNYKCGIVINKYDLNPEISEDIISLADVENITFLGKIPYDREFMKALIRYENILDRNSVYFNLMKEIVKNIEQNIKTEFIPELQSR